MRATQTLIPQLQEHHKPSSHNYKNNTNQCPTTTRRTKRTHAPNITRRTKRAHAPTTTRTNQGLRQEQQQQHQPPPRAYKQFLNHFTGGGHVRGQVVEEEEGVVLFSLGPGAASGFLLPLSTHPR
ncbi:hypothetical protein Pmani_037290 [Petrolisthes manimaculis]|uniref:Uncharacterized protein n=1 Tax=Petrolisthes manimaculis TaxID=1843537 RepID=A0AAE1NII3_9EUCA|nr:hypothetical protein Pmani_037290 [Petrolisthes manimaculis]